MVCNAGIRVTGAGAKVLAEKKKKKKKKRRGVARRGPGVFLTTALSQIRRRGLPARMKGGTFGVCDEEMGRGGERVEVNWTTFSAGIPSCLPGYEILDYPDPKTKRSESGVQGRQKEKKEEEGRNETNRAKSFRTGEKNRVVYGKEKYRLLSDED